MLHVLPVKHENIIYGNALNENSLLITGNKTGNDGIGGAVMASKEFDENVNNEDLKKNIQKRRFFRKIILGCLDAENYRRNKIWVGDYYVFY